MEARMTQYYHDMRAELDRRAARFQDEQALMQRREAIAREQRLRLAELRQKRSLRVHLRLLNLLEVRLPKVLLPAHLTLAKAPPQPLTLIWDPLTDAPEAPACPACDAPSFEFAVTKRPPAWHCLSCID